MDRNDQKSDKSNPVSAARSRVDDPHSSKAISEYDAGNSLHDPSVIQDDVFQDEETSVNDDVSEKGEIAAIKETSPDHEVPRKQDGLLRAADQLALSVIVLISILIIGGYYLAGYLRHGPYVEIEHAQQQQVEFRVDINQAKLPELTLLPGIGEQIAQRIVDYREIHGPFSEINELKAVSGLGESTVNKIRPYIVIR